MTVTLFEVGGCIRDDLLGVPTKDIDFTAEAESFDSLREWLTTEGFEIFVETSQHFTIRARFPKGVTTFGGRDVKGLTADFVLARKEGPYTDGRRPDWVEPGTLLDDLARRDLTVNAMAKDADGNLIDPFGGQRDLDARVLRAVGNVKDRWTEDSLRALRAIRFMIVKGFVLDRELFGALNSEWLPPLLANASVERIREELFKAFKANTVETMNFLTHDVNPEFTEACFRDGLWLEPSLKG